MARVIGIDVSKLRLDVYRLEDGRCLAVGNDAAGIAALADQLGLSARDLLAMEAWSGYERRTQRHLSERGLRVAIVSQIASPVGVVPIAKDSGARQGRRPIRGGRSGLRAPLYMAALVASRSNPTSRAVYERLRANAQRPKLALVVLMRKAQRHPSYHRTLAPTFRRSLNKTVARSSPQLEPSRI